jgi:hypothetical protein
MPRHRATGLGLTGEREQRAARWARSQLGVPRPLPLISWFRPSPSPSSHRAEDLAPVRQENERSPLAVHSTGKGHSLAG